ncbi:MAG TPA: hypothetical protein VML75_03685 [Kofleriaceae bacterium]|nr:hypothetical protein [Kofleriaceae bacterium]
MERQVRLTVWALATWAATSVASMLAYVYYVAQRLHAPDYPAVLAAEARLEDIDRLLGASEMITLALAAAAASWLARRAARADLRWRAWIAAACFAIVLVIWGLTWPDATRQTTDPRWLGAPRLILLALGWLAVIDLTARLAYAAGTRWAYAVAAAAAAMVFWRFGLGAVYAHWDGPRMWEFRPWLWAGARGLAQIGPAALLLLLAQRARTHASAPKGIEPAVRAGWAAAACFAVVIVVQLQQVFPSLRFSTATHVTVAAGAVGAALLARYYQASRAADPRSDPGAS